jgi:hypothetical protein
LFWLVLVVAMACAWWVERRTLIDRYENLVDYVEREGAEVRRVEGGHRILWTRYPNAPNRTPPLALSS